MTPIYSPDPDPIRYWILIALIITAFTGWYVAEADCERLSAKVIELGGRP